LVYPFLQVFREHFRVIGVFSFEEAIFPEADMESGTVRWFSIRKGHGFIKPDNGKHNVFVGVHAVHKAGLSDLEQGQRLTFEIDQDMRMDWACARSLALLDSSPPREGQAEGFAAISTVPARDWTQASTRSESRSFSSPISIWLSSALSVLVPRLSAW
jgi:CspA family cold shock protein